MEARKAKYQEALGGPRRRAVRKSNKCSRRRTLSALHRRQHRNNGRN